MATFFKASCWVFWVVWVTSLAHLSGITLYEQRYLLRTTKDYDTLSSTLKTVALISIGYSLAGCVFVKCDVSHLIWFILYTIPPLFILPALCIYGLRHGQAAKQGQPSMNDLEDYTIAAINSTGSIPTWLIVAQLEENCCGLYTYKDYELIFYHNALSNPKYITVGKDTYKKTIIEEFHFSCCISIPGGNSFRSEEDHCLRIVKEGKAEDRVSKRSKNCTLYNVTTTTTPTPPGPGARHAFHPEKDPHHFGILHELENLEGTKQWYNPYQTAWERWSYDNGSHRKSGRRQSKFHYDDDCYPMLLPKHESLVHLNGCGPAIIKRQEALVSAQETYLWLALIGGILMSIVYITAWCKEHGRRRSHPRLGSASQYPVRTTPSDIKIVNPSEHSLDVIDSVPIENGDFGKASTVIG